MRTSCIRKSELRKKKKWKKEFPLLTKKKKEKEKEKEKDCNIPIHALKVLLRQ